MGLEASGYGLLFWWGGGGGYDILDRDIMELGFFSHKDIFLGRNSSRCHDDTLTSFLAKVPLSQS